MKRKQKRVSWAYLALLATMIVYSCSKDFQVPESPISEVQFNISLPSSDGGRTAHNVEDVKYVLFSVESEDGSKPYEYKQLTLISLNGELISEPFSLEEGDYQLTDFFLLDDSGDALFATPQEGSTYAELVNNPLPNDFEVTKDEVTKLVPQVVSTEESTPKDFGYAAFGFEVVDYFEILLTVMVLDEDLENYKLVEAELTIEADGEVIVEKSLDAATNEIHVKDDAYEAYTISLSKEGYEDFSYTYSSDSLKSYEDSDPLIVVLTQNDGSLSGGLLGISKQDSVMLFVYRSYTGKENILGSTDNIGAIQDWTTSFSMEKSIYSISAFRREGPGSYFIVFDKNGQVLFKETDSFLLGTQKYSSEKDAFYGIKIFSGDLYFTSMSWGGVYNELREINSIYSGIATWSFFNSRGNYVTGLYDDELNQTIVILDKEGNEVNSFDITSNELYGHNLTYSQDEELMYGIFFDDTKNKSVLASIDFDGNEEIIAYFDFSLSNDYITYDNRNDAFVISDQGDMYVVNKSGEILQEISINDSQIRLSTVKPIQ